MKPAPHPPNEAARLQTLTGLNVLDTPADPVLDGLDEAVLADAYARWLQVVIEQRGSNAL